MKTSSNTREKHTTHYACAPMVKKYGKDVKCCGCTKHGCGPEFAHNFKIPEDKPSHPLQDKQEEQEKYEKAVKQGFEDAISGKYNCKACGAIPGTEHKKNCKWLAEQRIKDKQEVGFIKIKKFEFAPLSEIRKDLLDSGRTLKEVENVIAGLSELPEYATSRRGEHWKCERHGYSQTPSSVQEKKCPYDCDSWEKEYDKKWNRKHHKTKRKAFISNLLLKQKEEYRKAIDNLIDYVVHDKDCILCQWSAGENTKDGGYRSKFAGKWYQAKPIDKTPKCNCGLDKAFYNWKKLKKKLLNHLKQG